MPYFQLVEKAALPNSVWLTFWDLARQHQHFLEGKTAWTAYPLGSVFKFDQIPGARRLKVSPVADPAMLDGLHLLLPMPNESMSDVEAIGNDIALVENDDQGLVPHP